jgi:hypothetical protein
MSGLRWFSWVLLFVPLFAHADNILHPGTPVLDRPTLIALGIQLPVTGDDNYNGAVTVRYRVTGTAAWRQGQPLYRVHPESAPTWPIAPQFAGSIFDLRPNTTYDIELHAVDPDGPVDQILTLTGTTNQVPGDPANPRVRNVTDAASLSAAMATALPGDVITLANGIYPGTFGTGASGTAANPIVIRGASQDGVVLDGGGCIGCNIIELYGSFVHVEQLTLRNAERAIRFQTAGAQGMVVRRVHITNVTLGIGGRPPQYDHYIADNIVEGRLNWPSVYTDDNGAHSDDDGIAVTGFGMVVAHNRISGFGDAMKTQIAGARAVDFYGNDILWSYDNGVELDESEGNTRVMRNRFTNVYAPISVQPVYAGPAYILRNIELNTVDEQMKFHAEGSSQPNGVFAYHNTFVSPFTELQVQTPNASHHFAIMNNLFVAPARLPGYAVNWDAPIDDGVFDYNGHFPDGTFLFLRALSGYTVFPNFAAMQAGGINAHGRLLTGQIFASGLTAPTNYVALLAPQDVTPAAAGTAIDGGVVLPGVNDTYTGAAPDLGAIELGCPAAIYGPRPAGIDETNEPLGCETVTLPPPPSGTAAFVGADTTTGGSWKGVYGSEGFNVIDDTAGYPAYVNVAPSQNLNYTWVFSASEPRDLQKASSSDRIAACWYSGTSFNVDLAFSDANAHQVAFYFLDWDTYQGGRVQRVDIVDPSGRVLDARTVSSFTNGVYLIWNLSGHVTVRITNLNGPANAVLSGLFFGSGTPPPPPSGTAAFVRADTTTGGSWKGVYGSEGFNVIDDSAVYPAYVSVMPSQNLNYIWVYSDSDPRDLQKASSADRIAACWYSGTSFNVDLAFSDANTHRMALYFLDWDTYQGGRIQRVDLVDSSGSVLDTRTVSSFTNGVYLVWNLSGHVTARITNLNAPANAVLGGLFFR